MKHIGLTDNYIGEGGVCGVHEIKQYHKYECFVTSILLLILPRNCKGTFEIILN
jgi:hypothetical protein